MEALLLIAVILLIILLLAANKESKPEKLNCTIEHVDRDESYLSYYDQYSRLHTETDGCSGCIVERAAELQRQGMKVWKIELGRRNTGQL